MQRAAFATQTAAQTATELPGMLATLCSYESFFGPYHPQTLRLLTELGVAYWRHGETERARSLLERAIRDVGRFLGRGYELRLDAIVALRDLYIEQRELERAAAVQKELWECQTERLGSHHPETLAAVATLAAIMMESADSVGAREI